MLAAVDDRDQAPAAASGEQCDVARFADAPLPAERSTAECVEALDDRREFRWRRDCGEQRASVIGEAQPVDEPLVDPQGEELALGPNVDDGRLAAADCKPRSIGAELEEVESDITASMTDPACRRP